MLSEYNFKKQVYRMHVWVLSHVWLFMTLWAVARQLLSPQDSPGKNTGAGCHFLLQRIFLTQGLNLHLLLGRQILYYLSHLISIINTLNSHNAVCQLCLNKRKEDLPSLPNILSFCLQRAWKSQAQSRLFKSSITYQPRNLGKVSSEL